MRAGWRVCNYRDMQRPVDVQLHQRSGLDSGGAGHICRLERVPCRVGSLVFGALSVLRLYTPASVANVPQAIFMMLPFIATAIVLVVTSIRPSHKHQQPRSCGLNYYREDR